ncbi:GrpB family protein [Bellilinea sp.]
MDVHKPFRNYEPLPPQLKPADPFSILVADAVIGIILEELPALWIEHIGSTAVPGLAGSGIIDLMLVCSSGQIQNVVKTLERLGFEDTLSNDPLSSTFLIKVACFTLEGKTYPIHVYILSEGSPKINDLRNFRDRLRLDAAFRAAYQDLKRSFLSKGGLGIAEYARLKSEFIQKALS